MHLLPKKYAALLCLLCYFTVQSHAQLVWEKPNADIAFPIHDFASKGDTLFAGGWFGVLNNDTMPGPGVIEYYNGVWNNVGDTGGVVGRVEALAVYKDTLYVGGINHGSLKKWNGTTWELLPGLTINMNGPFEAGDNPNIYDLKVIDDELWVIGNFDSIGGIEANSVARWNGQIWQTGYDAPSAVGNGHINLANCVLEYKNEIYVSGNLNGDTLSEIMKYNGTEWTSVGGGIRDHGPAYAGNLTIYNDELYVVGSFLKATGNADNNVMRWNGTEWLPCGGGVSGPVVGATVHDGKLWVTGLFDYAGGVYSPNLACWDGTQWCSTGNDFSFTPQTLISFKDTLYASGKFATIDNDSIPIFAMWPGEGTLDSCGVELPLGFEDAKLETLPSLQIFPNPAQNELTISLPNSTQTPSIISILALDGSIVYQKTINNSGAILVDVGLLSHGVYIVQTITDAGIKSAKFVKN